MGSLARQALLNTALTYVGIALGFVNVVLLYPKVLSSEEFGLTRLLVSMVVMAAQIAQLGADNTINRYFPYFRDPARAHRGFLSMLLLFGVAVGLLAMLVLSVLHPWLSQVFSDRSALYARYGLLVLPLVFSEIFFLLLRSYSRSLRRTVQPTFIREFLLRVLQTLLIAWQAWRPMPFGSFIVVYASLFLICTLVLVYDLYLAGHWKPGWTGRWLPARMRRSMVAYGGFTLSASLAGIVLGNMDQLMIGALLGDGLKYVAHYAVAFYFGSVIAAPGRAIAQAALPHVADAWKRRDDNALRSMYLRSANMQTFISGTLFVLLLGNVDDLFLLLPAEYAGGAMIAVVIGSAYFLNASVGLSTSIISMSRSYRVDAWSSMVMLVINAVGNYFLILAYGIAGAAWATLISLVVVNGYRTYFLWRRHGLWPFDRVTAILVLGLTGSSIVVSWLPLAFGPLIDIMFRCFMVLLLILPLAHRFGLLKEGIALISNLRIDHR
ncbi:MAG: polysaccharide biosynthesis C-terminal domain-containing protein [Flavobacteriales bacterium]|nr:polysaccharide biosynthesis C-terminal domain-containing protein [Flavobacteriales bacterium]